MPEFDDEEDLTGVEETDPPLADENGQDDDVHVDEPEEGDAHI